MRNKFSILLVLVCVSLSASANVKLPRFISDGMVLQRNISIPVWGWADPGEKVTVKFKGRNYRTVTNADGKWSLNLAKSAEGGPFDMTVQGKNEINIKNILIGDVWVCSGQSNMEWNMNAVKAKYPGEIAASTNSKIRQFLVPKATSLEELDMIKEGEWKEANPKNILDFTAVGYFFANSLFEKYRVPIGLLHTSWGGTVAEAWMSEASLKEFPRHAERLTKVKSGEKANMPNEPAVLFNAMVKPLLPYAIKGTIWYQGESNAGRAHEYETLFPGLITDWRNQWKQGDFPFLFVQLANFMDATPEPVESEWAELRAAQAKTLSLKNTGMAVIIDIGEAKDIHPANKADVGRRLALAARKLAYDDKKVVYTGPVYQSFKVKKNQIVLKFSKTGSPLQARGGELKQFAIAGEDKKFVWAKAKIEEGNVIVWSDQVKNPVAVRYAWSNNPEGANLYNQDGLPASPFRTDDWPLITEGK
jgi:sialate O-acetylesterase